MTLIKTAREVMNFCRNPSKLVGLIWDELSSLDGRIDEAGEKKFTSEELTGTGSQQSIPHGLGVAPSVVLVSLTNVPDGGASITEGTHGTANINVTVTSGATFKVLAIA